MVVCLDLSQSVSVSNTYTVSVVSGMVSRDVCNQVWRRFCVIAWRMLARRTADPCKLGDALANEIRDWDAQWVSYVTMRLPYAPMLLTDEDRVAYLDRWTRQAIYTVIHRWRVFIACTSGVCEP